MKFSHTLLVVFLAGLTCSCATKSIYEQLKPPTTAVVLVDLKGYYSWHTANTSDPNGNFYVFKYKSIKYKGVPIKIGNQVFAIPVTVGSSFTITKLSHSSKFSETDIEPKWKSVKIEEEGIYYYGHIDTKKSGNQVSVNMTTALDKSLKDRAKKKYPKIFDKLRAINF